MPRIGEAPAPALTAVGITCGIGSMLVGAKQSGFRVLGNVEWRKYYHARDDEGRNTFLANFPGAVMGLDLDSMPPEQVARMTGATLAMGHPECGNFSLLGGSCKDRATRLKDPCDIPLFLDIVARLRPRFFVMDDLPKSFGAFSMEEYHRKLPGYDLFPEWVSNHGYGNVQKNRKRMFMVGSLREERWAFQPGEVDHPARVCDVIGDLDSDDTIGRFPNHDPHELDSKSGRFIHMPKYGDRPTWAEFAEYVMSVPEGLNFPYEKEDGTVKVRIGSCRVRWEGAAPVLHGGNPIIHSHRGLPLTIRERARIQGFPDDFVFYGTKLDAEGRWNHEKNLHMVKQTGKAMPVQFCRFAAAQIAAFVRGVPFECSGRRIINNSPDVDQAKQWYCREVGYSNQELACSRCWLAASCSIRTEKYGIGLTSAQQAEAPAPKKVRLPRVDEEVSVEMVPPGAENALAARVSRRRRTPTEPVQVVSPKTMIVRVVGDKPLPQVERVFSSPNVPKAYHCSCKYCQTFLGELIRRNGTYYSRLERRAYYDKIESGADGGHIAKTPLHVARWAIQEYTKPGDWVLDPTAGAGSTLVEATRLGRSAAGMELEFHDIIKANCRLCATKGTEVVIGLGDARRIADFVKGRRFHLVQNNPPYFGDQSFPSPAKEGVGPEFRHLETTFKYDKSLPNLAFLKEGAEYWRWIESIYRSCAEVLVPGGRFVVGVKDQMRNRKPDQLHEKLGDVLAAIGLEFEGVAVLKHYPTTLHLNTYKTRFGVHPPYYQSIVVFRKKE